MRLATVGVVVLLACGKEPARPDAAAGMATDDAATADAAVVAVVAADAGDVPDAAVAASVPGTSGTPRVKDGGNVEGPITAHGDVTLGDGDAGKVVELAKGHALVVSLAATPTSGFDWSVRKAPAALGTPALGYVAPASGAMGAAGKRTITFTLGAALPPGEHVVELGYARSFEKGVAPFKTFAFKVRAGT